MREHNNECKDASYPPVRGRKGHYGFISDNYCNIYVS